MNNTGAPLVIAILPDASCDAGFYDSLACPDFDVATVTGEAALKERVSDNADTLSALLLDARFPLNEKFAWMDRFANAALPAKLPVFVMLDDAEADVEVRLLEAGASNVLHGVQNLNSLRVKLTIAIEGFGNVRALKEELERRSSAIGQIVSGSFRVTTRREGRNLATMLSMACDDPLPVAIGLTELIVNGVEHGCLAISHDLKGTLIEAGILNDEIQRRRALPEYAGRYVTVDFQREPDKLVFRVTDPGDGFDYNAYRADTVDSAKKHGRGILMARGCFERVKYSGRGNVVTAIKNLPCTSDP